MGIYVQISCPSCHNVLENYTRKYIAIGPPFTECQLCGTLVKLNHMNEWGLMSFGTKAKQVVVHLWTNVFWSMGPFALLMIAAMFLTNMDFESPGLAGRYPIFLPTSFILSFLIVLLIRSFGFAKQIKLSNKRIENQTYRDKLQELGVSVKSGH